MVRFDNIFIKLRDEELGFNCLSLFNEFRKELWVQGPGFESQLLKATFLRQFKSERRLEKQFKLPKGTLTGVCLIFGSEIAAKKQLEKQEVVEFLSHWATSATVVIDVVNQKIQINTVSKYLTCRTNLPLRRALLPQKAAYETAYASVAMRRQLGHNNIWSKHKKENH